jgi:hypothetical protein
MVTVLQSSTVLVLLRNNATATTKRFWVFGTIHHVVDETTSSMAGVIHCCIMGW